MECFVSYCNILLQESLQNYKTVQLISKEAFDELHSNLPPPIPANQKVPPPPPLPAATVSGQFLYFISVEFLFSATLFVICYFGCFFIVMFQTLFLLCELYLVC